MHSLLVDFLQACRGNQVDKGEEVSSPSSNDPSSEGTDNAKSYKIPTHADFLIAHSSVKGKYYTFTLIFSVLRRRIKTVTIKLIILEQASIYFS